MGHPPDLSYCELRNKEIINTVDGRRLGRIVDIIFSSITGEVRGIIAPFMKRVFFGRNQEIFIPWNCINKIGEDVILVAVVLEGSYNMPRDRRMNFDNYVYGNSGGSARVCGNSNENADNCSDNVNYDRHNTNCGNNFNGNQNAYEQQYKDAYANSQNKEHKQQKENAGQGQGNFKQQAQSNFNQNSFNQNSFNQSNFNQNGWDSPDFNNSGTQMPKCDRKCEKCMLFDCAYRWK